MPKRAVIKSKYLLLDTHVWIWLINGSDELSAKDHIAIIEQYARQQALRICPISVWELGMLVAKKRVVLSKDMSQWVKESLSGHGLVLEPLTIDILLNSTHMEQVHGDPADRLILATAHSVTAAVMTADSKMIAYCRQNNLPVVAVR